MSEPQSRGPSKRQRTRGDDDVFSEQSVSDVAITELSERTCLLHPSFSSRLASKRATSPVRDLLNDLRVSKPAILCETPAHVTLPRHASAMQHRLMSRLEEDIIPSGPKDRVLATYPSVAVSIPASSYDASHTLSVPELDAVWDCVVDILGESRDCGKYQQEENAWCMKVVYPLLRLALKGTSALKVESVQTQTIHPDVLPVTPRNYRVQRKADFTFSFHRNTPEASDIYNRLGLAGLGEAIGQRTERTQSD